MGILEVKKKSRLTEKVPVREGFFGGRLLVLQGTKSIFSPSIKSLRYLLACDWTTEATQ